MVIDMMQFLSYHFLEFRTLRVSPNLRSHAYKVHWFCVFLANKWPEWRRWMPYCFSIKTKMSILASLLQCNYPNFKLEILHEDCFYTSYLKLGSRVWVGAIFWDDHTRTVSLCLTGNLAHPMMKLLYLLIVFQPSNQNALKVTSAKAISLEYGPRAHQCWRLYQFRQSH